MRTDWTSTDKLDIASINEILTSINNLCIMLKINKNFEMFGDGDFAFLSTFQQIEDTMVKICSSINVNYTKKEMFLIDYNDINKWSSTLLQIQQIDFKIYSNYAEYSYENLLDYTYENILKGE